MSKHTDAETSAPALDWEVYEGGHDAYDASGAHVIHIDALQDAAKAVKWGEGHLPGRAWTVYRDEAPVAQGRALDLRAARKAALAALAALEARA